jgi:MFS family permease
LKKGEILVAQTGAAPRPREGANQTYVATLVVFTTLGVLLAAFDSIARNVAFPLILHALKMNVAQGALIFSGAFGVTFLASLLMGPLMDRLGRKRAFLLALVAAGLTSGATAFIQTVGQYVAVGILAGVCLAVLQPAGVLVAEEAPARWRGTLMAITHAGFSGGAILVSLIGSAVLPSGDWRVLFYLCFSPLLLAAVGAFALREPPRSQEAIAVKRARDRIARGERLVTNYQIDEEKATHNEWRQIFAPDLRRQTLVITIAGFLINFSPALVLALGVTFMTVFDHLAIGAASLAMAVESFAVLIGTLVSGSLTDRFGPRNVVILWTLLGGISLGLLAVRGEVGWVTGALAGYGFFGQGALSSWIRYVNDSFPTRARGSGVGFVNGVYFLGGGTLGPIVFGTVIQAGHAPVAPLVAAGCSIASGLLLFLGRPIRPRLELEEIAS